jgi:hypothetical protein
MATGRYINKYKSSTNGVLGDPFRSFFLLYLDHIAPTHRSNATSVTIHPPFPANLIPIACKIAIAITLLLAIDE